MKTDKKIVSYSRLAHALRRIRKGKKIVVATGTFDMLHTGHLLFLDFAKRQGDILIVGIGSDRTVKMYKGDVRPIIPENLRLRLVAGLEIVDFVVMMDEDPIEKIGGRKFFAIAKPDIWVVPYRDHNPAGVKKFAKELGTKIVRNPRIPPSNIDFPISTSYIFEKIRNAKKL